MNPCIYILDTYKLEENTPNWQNLARSSLTKYADLHDIPIFFIGNDDEYIKRFRSISSSQEGRSNLEKLIRWYIFNESEYDYAFFIDLDTVVVSKYVNIAELVDTDCMYFNLFARNPSTGKVTHERMRQGRKDWLTKFNPDLTEEDYIHFCSGFMSCSKDQCSQVLDFLDRHNLNIMNQDHLNGIPLFTWDEALLNAVINSSEFHDTINYKLAANARLCEERYFVNKDKDVALFHLIGDNFSKHQMYSFCTRFSGEA